MLLEAKTSVLALYLEKMPEINDVETLCRQGKANFIAATVVICGHQEQIKPTENTIYALSK